MKKDFFRWHSRKEQINDIAKLPFFHEREIWFCHLGANVGFEQDGRGDEFLRPVIITRKFNKEIFWAIPLTKTEKGAPFYFSFHFGDVQSTAILSQIRLLDVRRLSYKIGVIPKNDFKLLKEKLRALLP